MEAKRLIPYSVHLPEDVYVKLKEAAGQRKASALVRDAITLIVEGDDEFNGGYNKGVRDCIRLIQQNELCKAIGYYDETLAKILSDQIEELVVNQNTKAKNGTKKKG
jgi:hypothetical protein